MTGFEHNATPILPVKVYCRRPGLSLFSILSLQDFPTTVI
jgi:hypothetical protein